MYTFTYLSTATDMNNLLHSIVAYERERLTCIIEGSMRTQAYARADRTAVSASLSELTTTSGALAMHFDQYRGDDADNVYAELTPMALRRSIGMVGLLREVAQSEADLRFWQSEVEPDGSVAGDLRNEASDILAYEFFLYGKAQQMSAACIAYGVETLS